MESKFNFRRLLAVAMILVLTIAQLYSFLGDNIISHLFIATQTESGVPDDDLDHPEANKTIADESLQQTAPFTMFYNIYIPRNNSDIGIINHTLFANQDDMQDHPALRIVQEQLEQIGRSYAANMSNSTPLIIHYNTIGKAIQPDWMLNLCNTNGVRCLFLNHYSTAYEEVTLHDVHEYCARNNNNSTRVAYLHTKGSYHDNAANSRWRQHMTRAVVHKDCVRPPNSTCNVCGLVFNPWPWNHYSGNFWVAKCEYVNQLLPIQVYREQLERLYETTVQYMNEGLFLNKTFRSDRAYFGLDRFANEHWPGSHPSLTPCDVSNGQPINKYKRSSSSLDLPLAFRMAPHESEGAQPKKYANWPHHQRMRDYYLLAGNLFKWTRLYNQVPPKHSWIWKFYPDGAEWSAAYERLGNDVVEVLTAQYRDQDQKY
jgi:hypothetical protein